MEQIPKKIQCFEQVSGVALWKLKSALQQFHEEFSEIFLEKCWKINPEIISKGMPKEIPEKSPKIFRKNHWRKVSKIPREDNGAIREGISEELVANFLEELLEEFTKNIMEKFLKSCLRESPEELLKGIHEEYTNKSLKKPSKKIQQIFKKQKKLNLCWNWGKNTLNTSEKFPLKISWGLTTKKSRKQSLLILLTLEELH